MRHRPLHTALRAFADEAATALAADVAAGDEVPFELATEGRKHRTPLYCYRPLTGAYIRERLGKLAKLASYAPAARALEQLDGLDGIGPTLAKRIIDYRESHGGFRSVDELREVDGIGEKRFAALRKALRP